MPKRHLDTLDFSHDLYAATERSMAFSATSIDEARRW